MGGNGSDSNGKEKRLYYHGLKETKRMNVSLLKYISVLISVLGVALMLIFAQAAEAPAVKISDAYGNYMMNYAVVKVTGTVVSVPRVSESGGKLSLSFSVNDGTGTLDVRVYDPLASEMLKEGKLPFPGDNVSLEVQLKVRETYTYGILQYLGGLKFISRMNTSTPEHVRSLTKDLNGRFVALGGVVSEVRNVSSGVLMTVDTGEDRVTVLVPAVLLLSNNFTVERGDMFHGSGLVYLYHGSPELIVRSLGDVEIESASEAPEVSFGEVPTLVGSMVSVEGRLETISYESGLYAVTLSNGSASLTVLSDRATLSAIDPFTTDSGSVVKAAGLVNDQGELVVSYLGVVEPRTPAVRPIGLLTKGMAGRLVVVEGNIVDVSHVGSNLKLSLNDGTGKVDVFMPSPVLRELNNATKEALVTGLGVRVGGYLEQYRGGLEVVVYSGKYVRAYGRPIANKTVELPNVTATQLGDYVGQKVNLVGGLEAISYSGGVYHVNVGGADVVASRELLLSVNPLVVGPGSRLLVEGTVVNASSLVAERVEVLNAVQPRILNTGQVNLGMVNSPVAVQGTVTDAANLSGNLKLTLDGKLDVFIPGKTASALHYMPSIGDYIRVGGYVEEYRGKPEVVVYHPGAVVRAERAGAVRVTVSELSSSSGQVYLVATWNALGYRSGRYYLNVSDATGKTSLLVGRELLAGLNPFSVGTGSVLNITLDAGTRNVSRIEVVTPHVSRLVKTGDVGGLGAGTTAVVEGRVVDVLSGGSFMKLAVDDGSGNVTVFIPGGVLSGDIRSNLTEGVRLKVAGYVEFYKGAPEIVVYVPSGVVILGAPSSGNKVVSVANLESSSGLVNVTATWKLISYGSGSYFLTIEDGTGSAKVEVPRDLLSSLNPLEVGTGSILSLTVDADSMKVTGLRVVKAVPSQEPKTGDVKNYTLGVTVVVGGRVTDVYTGSTFVKLTIDDGSGPLVIFIPKSVIGQRASEIQKGVTVRIGGYVGEYKGTVEVIPYTGDAIVIGG